jgi:diguanylate cyclase (GGDEF)-like protein/PAS domain S-box-containing protein
LSNTTGEFFEHGAGDSPLLAKVERYLLLAKARWLFLALIGLYGSAAALGFYLAGYEWFLSPPQALGLLLGMVWVISYNAVYQHHSERMARLPFSDVLQVVLDYFSVSFFIHLSGGSASWFWPVYIIITFEAAILIEGRVRVVNLGLFGGICYGLVLYGEYLDIIPNLAMPFIDPALHHDKFYLVLMWMWVCLLNTIAAVVGDYLMNVLRGTYHRFQQTQNRLKQYIRQANDLIFSIDAKGQILYANDSCIRALGYSDGFGTEIKVADIFDTGLRAKALDAIEAVLNGAQAAEFDGRLVNRDGDMIDVEGSVTGNIQGEDAEIIWVSCRDVTLRKKAQEQLYFMAHHDILTGLPNRLFFADRLRQAQALSERMQHFCAVLYLDLDRFKIINDTLGHAVGDKLLKEVGQRLKNSVRVVDTVSRLGGDEFAIVLVNIKQVADAEHVAEKILKAMAQPIIIDDHEVYISTSIGISLAPNHGKDPVLLLKKADAAMYRAKAQGRNGFQIYEPNLQEGHEQRIEMETGLRKALERNEFMIYYQPKINAVSGQITAMEALIRWQHPTQGILNPADFIPVAEETGLIIPVGEWVIRQACRDNLDWQAKGLPKIRVAVNLSGYQLHQKNLKEFIARLLDEEGMAGEYLEFEIAETVIMQNPEFAISILTKLKELGVHISIDGFGSGYSSLAELKRFSINTLKIDKTFVRDIEISSTDAAIANAIITMGNSLNVNVVAEGVETEGQFNLLKEQRCDEVQGYLFSRPVPAAKVEDLLRQAASLPQRQVVDMD